MTPAECHSLIERLLIWLAVGLQPNVGFEHFITTVAGKQVVLFAVNPAFDRPVKFYGEAFIRVGSSKSHLAPHPEKERAIWSRRADWTAKGVRTGNAGRSRSRHKLKSGVDELNRAF